MKILKCGLMICSVANGFGVFFADDLKGAIGGAALCIAFAIAAAAEK